MTKRQSTLKNKVSKRQTQKFSKKGGRKSMKKPASKQRKIKLGGQQFSAIATQTVEMAKKKQPLNKLNNEEAKRLRRELISSNRDGQGKLILKIPDARFLSDYISHKFEVKVNKLSPDYPWLNLVMEGKARPVEIKASDNGVGGLYYTLDANHINLIERFLRDQQLYKLLEGNIDAFINQVKRKFGFVDKQGHPLPSPLLSKKEKRQKKEKEKNTLGENLYQEP